MTPEIILDMVGPLATITLNRPAQHNALRHVDIMALIDALAKIEKTEGIRAVLITGRGEKTFCAGAALDQLGSGQIHPDMFDEMNTTLADFPLPTICALNGSAYGAGVEIALCCDLRIGVTKSRLAVPAARLGLCYPLNGLQRFTSRLGVGLAKRLLVGGETILAEEMYRLGFLYYLVERTELVAKQTELVNRVIALAPLAAQGMKRLINQFALSQWDDLEAQAIYQQCLNSQDLQEGFAAHAEKRKPVFRGD